MPNITIDNIKYNLPPVVYDILMATVDERDEYRDRVAELEGAVRSLHALAESHFGIGAIDVPAMPELHQH